MWEWTARKDQHAPLPMVSVPLILHRDIEWILQAPHKPSRDWGSFSNEVQVLGITPVWFLLTLRNLSPSNFTPRLPHHPFSFSHCYSPGLWHLLRFIHTDVVLHLRFCSVLSFTVPSWLGHSQVLYHGKCPEQRLVLETFVESTNGLNDQNMCYL